MSSTQLLLPLFALIAPFLIWPVEQILPYPHIIEELAKALVVYYLAGTSLSVPQKVKQAVLLASLFTFSESVFYLINFIDLSLMPLIQRLFLTGILHVTTVVVLLTSALYSRKLIWLGLIIAIALHYLYNLTLGLGL
jgi:RsiW-degrading membrane proteinase PrsW (M82 family)